MKTVHPKSESTNVQEPDKESRSKETYRAPRLLELGKAVELLQGSWSGGFTDGGQPPFRH
jgi:hypothetical protein